MRWFGSWTACLLLATGSAAAADAGSSLAAKYAVAFPRPGAGWKVDAPELRPPPTGAGGRHAAPRDLTQVYRSDDGAVVRLVLTTNPTLAAVIAIAKGGGPAAKKLDASYRAHEGLDGIQSVDDRGRVTGILLEVSPGLALAVEVQKFGRDPRVAEAFLKRCDLGGVAAAAERLVLDPLVGPDWKEAAKYAPYFPAAPSGWGASTPAVTREDHMGLFLTFVTSVVLSRAYHLDGGTTVRVVLASEELDDEPKLPFATAIAVLKDAAAGERGLGTYRHAELDGMRGVDRQGRVTFVCLALPKSGLVLVRAESFGRDREPVEKVLRMLDLEKLRAAFGEMGKDGEVRTIREGPAPSDQAPASPSR